MIWADLAQQQPDKVSELRARYDAQARQAVRPKVAPRAPGFHSPEVWGEGGLIGRPAILDMPEGRGHVVAFNFNPLHRDLNRGDQRMVWNAIINWQAILKPTPASGP